MLFFGIYNIISDTLKFTDSGAWIRTMDLRVMSPSGFPDYPTPLLGVKIVPPSMLMMTDKDFGYAIFEFKLRSLIILEHLYDYKITWILR